MVNNRIYEPREEFGELVNQTYALNPKEETVKHTTIEHRTSVKSMPYTMREVQQARCEGEMRRQSQWKRTYNAEAANRYMQKERDNNRQ